jgi:hypothetical protein
MRRPSPRITNRQPGADDTQTRLRCSGRQPTVSSHETQWPRSVASFILRRRTPIAAETNKAWARSSDEFTDLFAIGQEFDIGLCLGLSYVAGAKVARADGPGDLLRNEELGWTRVLAGNCRHPRFRRR